MFCTKICLALLFCLTLNAREVIVFSPLPMTDKRDVVMQVLPMVSYLEKELGVDIRIDFNKDYAQILEKIRQGKIDIAHLGPLPYIKLKQTYTDISPLVLFKGECGNTYFRCSLVTFITNHIEIGDTIKGKKIALTQPLSTCGYLGVQSMLKASNSSLVKNRYRFLGRHDRVALSIIRGEFDFGGVKQSIARKYRNLGLREIATTEPFPNHALVANTATLSSQMIKEITEAMLSAKKDEFSSWGSSIRFGIKRASDEDFERLREAKNSIEIPEKGNF